MTTTNTIVRLNGIASRYFQTLLRSTPAAMEILGARGLTGETIDRWGLGYAPAASNGLLRELARAGYGEVVAIEAGLAVPSRRGGALDLLRDRLVFPILSESLRDTVGFVARRVRDDGDGLDPRKYLNSPETAVFKKSASLYGLPNADEIRRTGEAIIVEGPLDMLALWGAGIRNVVAICGTALTAAHCEVLATMCGKVSLAFDSDAAGTQATRRALTLPATRRLDVGVIRIPPNPDGSKQDPDGLLRAGPRMWSALAASRVSRWEALWQMTLAPFAEHLAGDIEARIAWKDAWCAVVREHRGPDDDLARLLSRCERRLQLPLGILVADVEEPRASLSVTTLSRPPRRTRP